MITAASMSVRVADRADGVEKAAPHRAGPGVDGRIVDDDNADGAIALEPDYRGGGGIRLASSIGLPVNVRTLAACATRDD